MCTAIAFGLVALPEAGCLASYLGARFDVFNALRCPFTPSSCVVGPGAGFVLIVLMITLNLLSMSVFKARIWLCKTECSGSIEVGLFPMAL